MDIIVIVTINPFFSFWIRVDAGIGPSGATAASGGVVAFLDNSAWNDVE